MPLRVDGLVTIVTGSSESGFEAEVAHPGWPPPVGLDVLWELQRACCPARRVSAQAEDARERAYACVRNDKREGAYSEKLVPQPQDDFAFGLLTLNDAPIRS